MTLRDTIEEIIEKEFEEKFLVINVAHPEIAFFAKDLKPDVKSFLKAALERVAREAAAAGRVGKYKSKLNPTEIAEEIVIEYANISGRESENRAYVRQAALTILIRYFESGDRLEVG